MFPDVDRVQIVLMKLSNIASNCFDCEIYPGIFRSQDRNEVEEAKQKSSGLFDPQSKAFTRSFYVTMSLLVTAFLGGLIWHFGKYKRRQRENERALESLSELETSARFASKYCLTLLGSEASYTYDIALCIIPA